MQRDGDIEMRRSCNKDGAAMKDLLPICFATVRKVH